MAGGGDVVARAWWSNENVSGLRLRWRWEVKSTGRKRGAWTQDRADAPGPLVSKEGLWLIDCAPWFG